MSKVAKQIGFRLNQNFRDRLDHVCEETGCNISSFVREAVVDRIMEEEKKLANHSEAVNRKG